MGVVGFNDSEDALRRVRRNNEEPQCFFLGLTPVEFERGLVDKEGTMESSNPAANRRQDTEKVTHLSCNKRR